MYTIETKCVVNAETVYNKTCLAGASLILIFPHASSTKSFETVFTLQRLLHLLSYILLYKIEHQNALQKRLQHSFVKHIQFMSQQIKQRNSDNSECTLLGAMYMYAGGQNLVLCCEKPEKEVYYFVHGILFSFLNHIVSIIFYRRRKHLFFLKDSQSIFYPGSLPAVISRNLSLVSKVSVTEKNFLLCFYFPIVNGHFTTDKYHVFYGCYGLIRSDSTSTLNHLFMI